MSSSADYCLACAEHGYRAAVRAKARARAEGYAVHARYDGAVVVYTLDRGRLRQRTHRRPRLRQVCGRYLTPCDARLERDRRVVHAACVAPWGLERETL